MVKKLSRKKHPGNKTERKPNNQAYNSGLLQAGVEVSKENEQQVKNI